MATVQAWLTLIRFQERPHDFYERVLNALKGFPEVKVLHEWRPDTIHIEVSAESLELARHSAVALHTALDHVRVAVEMPQVSSPQKQKRLRQTGPRPNRSAPRTNYPRRAVQPELWPTYPLAEIQLLCFLIGQNASVLKALEVSTAIASSPHTVFSYFKSYVQEGLLLRLPKNAGYSFAKGAQEHFRQRLLQALQSGAPAREQILWVLVKNHPNPISTTDLRDELQRSEATIIAIASELRRQGWLKSTSQDEYILTDQGYAGSLPLLRAQALKGEGTLVYLPPSTAPGREVRVTLGQQITTLFLQNDNKALTKAELAEALHALDNSVGLALRSLVGKGVVEHAGKKVSDNPNPALLYRLSESGLGEAKQDQA